MKLARFSTLLEAQNQITKLNNLAKTISSTEPFNLTEINSSNDNSFYWFIFDPNCLENAGFNRHLIEIEETKMDIYEFDGIPSDWLPNMNDPII